MPINVQFSDVGWYHPAFGRLGRGKNVNKIYVLPDQFGEKETIKVPIMDRTAKPPKQIGEREVTRYKHIPSDAMIFDELALDDLREEAEESGEEPPEVVRARPIDTDELQKVTGAGKRAKAQSAQERTTGTKKRRTTRRKPAAATE